MFPMTVTINDQAQLGAVMAALGMTPQTVTKAPSRSQTTVKKPDPTPESIPESTPEAPTTPEPAPTDETVTYAQCAAAVTKLARVKGRDAAVAVLSKFGIDKLPSAKPDQYADIKAACEEAEA